MKTVEVRILPAPTQEQSAESSFLLVETMASSEGEETSIEHILRDTAGDDGKLTKSSIANSLTATHKVAVEWAAAFAALNEIPVVYERRKDEIPVACERRKED